MKINYIQYFVEGECEEKLINTLKSELMVVKTGRVQKLNVIENEISKARLIALRPGTMVVLIFDTDTGNTEILNKNIKKLSECGSVADLVLIPQVKNLEDELVKSCRIRNVKELLGSKSNKEFKGDFIRVTNLANKLKSKEFDINLIWKNTPLSPYQNIKNDARKIKNL